MSDPDDEGLKSGRTARDLALALLRETDTCTLATAAPDGVPEAATVRFVTDDDHSVYVNTATDYRKYENVQANPRVAVVVTGHGEPLQLEGVATARTPSSSGGSTSKSTARATPSPTRPSRLSPLQRDRLSESAVRPSGPARCVVCGPCDTDTDGDGDSRARVECVREIDVERGRIDRQ